MVFTPRAWTLGVYFGLINGGYASLIAWLPAFYIEIGASAQYSGSLLALMTLGQAAGALLMPAMARHQDRRKLLMLALVLQLVGFCGFIWLPLQLPVLWAMVCGLGLGGAFPLCLLLALDHSVQPAIAGKLVAFMQGIGFIIAGLAPWFSGAGSIVTKDIPPNVVAAGVPCRVIREINDRDKHYYFKDYKVESSV